jgi:hypothetical protein
MTFSVTAGFGEGLAVFAFQVRGKPAAVCVSPRIEHVVGLRVVHGSQGAPVLGFCHLRGLAVALSVSTDALVFNEDERGPDSPDLRLHLEALNQLDDDERATIVNLIESVLLRHQARRLARTS